VVSRRATAIKPRFFPPEPGTQVRNSRQIDQGALQWRRVSEYRGEALARCIQCRRIGLCGEQCRSTTEDLEVERESRSARSSPALFAAPQYFHRAMRLAQNTNPDSRARRLVHIGHFSAVRKLGARCDEQFRRHRHDGPLPVTRPVEIDQSGAVPPASCRNTSVPFTGEVQ